MRKTNIKLSQTKKQKEFWEDFGRFIRQKRLETGLSEHEVSEYLGATAQTILSYETGEKAIPLNRVYALANCLNISPEMIMKKLGSWDLLRTS